MVLTDLSIKEINMVRKEFVNLMEENVMLLDRLEDRLHINPAHISGYPRNQMVVLVRLYMGGRGRLKDIARREGVSTPNLCASFRKLERDGLIQRVMDENDRRNVWYSVTDSGRELSLRVLENFRSGIASMFSTLSSADERTMSGALKTINSILKNME